jgi:hypothetical protein
MTNVRTYAQDLLVRDSGYGYGTEILHLPFGEHHMAATLAEMCRTSFYYREGGSVEYVNITWHRLDRGGYTRTGEYFGSGPRVYAVDCDTGTHVRTFWIRAPNRPTLRAALKRLYPLSKVSA